MITKFQEFSRVLQGRKFVFPGPNPNSRSKQTKEYHQVISTTVAATEVTKSPKKIFLKLSLHIIKKQKFNLESDDSAGFGLLIKLLKNFPQNSRSFSGVQGNYLFFQEFSEPWMKISKFQEFPRNYRSTVHHVSNNVG